MYEILAKEMHGIHPLQLTLAITWPQGFLGEE